MTFVNAMGEVKLSNGSRLTMVDWRANRLVSMIELEVQLRIATWKLEQLFQSHVQGYPLMS